MLPEVTPPPKVNQPQNPMPIPVPVPTPVPEMPICQFALLPYASVGAGEPTPSSAVINSASRDGARTRRTFASGPSNERVKVARNMCFSLCCESLIGLLMLLSPVTLFASFLGIGSAQNDGPQHGASSRRTMLELVTSCWMTHDSASSFPPWRMTAALASAV